jgi:hypothetical protein
MGAGKVTANRVSLVPTGVPTWRKAAGRVIRFAGLRPMDLKAA